MIFTTCVNKNGIKKIGFNTIGRPNNSGSLIQKKAGTIESFQIVLICSERLFNINSTRPNVAPPPPIVTYV